MDVKIKFIPKKIMSMIVYGSKSDLARTVYLTDGAAGIPRKYRRFIFKDYQVKAW